MDSSKDKYESIIRFMWGNKAYLTPLKTRVIANGCEMSVYLARYYLQELNRRHVVEPDSSSKGSSIYWYLVN
ncbi:hypothetical protein ROB41_004934 [Escherichia coli]|nr:hypothetical protein [Escherichia coli]